MDFFEKLETNNRLELLHNATEAVAFDMHSLTYDADSQSINNRQECAEDLCHRLAHTGSDNSRMIARELRVVVIGAPRKNHYPASPARSVTTGCVFVLDTDEELSKEAVAEVPKLLTCSDIAS